MLHIWTFIRRIEQFIEQKNFETSTKLRTSSERSVWIIQISEKSLKSNSNYNLHQKCACEIFEEFRIECFRNSSFTPTLTRWMVHSNYMCCNIMHTLRFIPTFRVLCVYHFVHHFTQKSFFLNSLRFTANVRKHAHRYKEVVCVCVCLFAAILWVNG